MLFARWRQVAVAAFISVMLCGSTAAAPPPAQPVLSTTEAVTALQAYGIIDPQPPAQLRLQDPLTRAELSRILGSLLQLTPDAPGDSAPVTPFADTAGHWGEAWITALQQRGLTAGFPDGTYRPDTPVSYAELVTFLLRITGRAAEAADNWYYGAAAEAERLGWIPPDLSLGGRWQEPARRGDVFRLVAIAAGQRPQKGSTHTLLHDLHDQQPPVLTLDPVEPVTAADSITLSGTATGAVQIVVAGPTETIAVTPAADGTFQAALSHLFAGANTVTVTAIDGAGNRAASSLTVYCDPDLQLALTPALVQTGVDGLFTLTPAWTDGAQTPAPPAVTWQYDTTVFARQTDGRFKALTPGTHTITASSGRQTAAAQIEVAGPPAQLEVRVDHATLPVGGGPTPVRIRILDASGRVNPTVNQQIGLTTTPAGTGKFNATGVKPVDGTAVVYLSPGSATTGFGIQAKLGSLYSDIVPVQVEARRPAAFRLEPDPAAVSANSGSLVTLHATLLDQVGVPIPAETDTVITLQSPDLSWSQSRIVIEAGYASSADGGSPARAVTTGADAVTVSGYAADLADLTVELPVRRNGVLDHVALSVLQEVAPADGIHAALVVAHRQTAAGDATAADLRPLVLVASSAKAQITRLTPPGAVEWYAVRSTTAGAVTLTAGIPGDAAYNSNTVTLTYVPAAVTPRLAVRTDAEESYAGDTIPVFVELLDAAGNPLPNPGPPLAVTLAGVTDGGETITVTLPPGASESDRAEIELPDSDQQRAISVTISGTTGIKAAEVLRLSARPQPAEPEPGSDTDATPQATYLIAATSPIRAPVAGEEVRFTITAAADETLIDDSYAFTVKVRLNGRELAEPPADLTVAIGGESVFGHMFRTRGGTAEVWVRYTGTGTVAIEPVPRPATAAAYDDRGVRGYGRSSVGITAVAGTVTYVPGVLDHLAYTISDQFADSPLAVFKSGPGRYTTVTLTPSDQYGNPTGMVCDAALTLVSGSPANALLIRTAEGDVSQAVQSLNASTRSAQFVVVHTQTADADSLWDATLTCGSTTLTAGPLRIATTTVTPPVPTVAAAGGDVSGAGTLTASDDVLQITLEQTSTALPYGAEVWLYSGDTLIGRYGPVDPGADSAGARTISVPRTLLGSGSRTLYLHVRLHSGAALSNPSQLFRIRAVSLP